MSVSFWPHGWWPIRLPCPQNPPGNNTGVGSHSLLQGIFLTQGSNPCLLLFLHCKWILYHWATWQVLETHILTNTAMQQFSNFCDHQTHASVELDSEKRQIRTWSAFRCLIQKEIKLAHLTAAVVKISIIHCLSTLRILHALPHLINVHYSLSNSRTYPTLCAKNSKHFNSCSILEIILWGESH